MLPLLVPTFMQPEIRHIFISFLSEPCLIMVAAEIYCHDRIVILPRWFPTTCPFSFGNAIHHSVTQI